MVFLKKDKLSLEQERAIEHSQILLWHINHRDIVPKVYLLRIEVCGPSSQYSVLIVLVQVFGIRFDRLTAKAAFGLVVSAFPTMFMFILNKIDWNK